MAIEVKIRPTQLPQNLLPDISVPQHNTKRMQTLLGVLEPKLGPEPYGFQDLELTSPIGEDYMQALVDAMLSLSSPEGQALFTASDNLAQISRDAATCRALETMYVGPNRNGFTDSGQDYSWSRLFIDNIHNSMAVRNRKRLVAAEFGHFLEARLIDSSQDIEVLSIAAGSSRGLMEAVAGLDVRKRDRIQLTMIDLSRNALQDGEKLAKLLGINTVKAIRSPFNRYDRYLPAGYRPHFVEIVGLLDYLEEEQVIELLSQNRTHLADGGQILYSNIAPNDEQDFTHQIVGWPDMKYRKVSDLLRFAASAGFTTDQLRVIPEPLGVYNLVSATF